MRQLKWRERENVLLGNSFSARESALQSPLHRRAAMHCGKSGLLCFEGAGGRWQQMKLAGCGVLFLPPSGNEQASQADWVKNGSPGAPSLLFFIHQPCCPCGEDDWKHTNTGGHTCSAWPPCTSQQIAFFCGSVAVLLVALYVGTDMFGLN